MLMRGFAVAGWALIGVAAFVAIMGRQRTDPPSEPNGRNRDRRTRRRHRATSTGPACPACPA